MHYSILIRLIREKCRVPCVGMGADVFVERVLVLERFPALFAAQIFGLNLVQEPTKIREGKFKQFAVY